MGCVICIIYNYYTMSKQILSEEFKRMQKLAGIITENVNIKMKIFDLKDQNGNSTELFKIENFTNTDEVIDTLNKHLNTDELHTEDTGTGYNYAYVAGDGDVKFVKSLDEFDEGFKTEEEWGVASAEEITQENDDYPVELGGTNSLSTKDINLLQFVKQNKDEIAEKIGAVRLKNIMIDDLGDVGATGIYVDETDDTGEEMEGGLAFRFPKDVDDDFVGENGDEPNSINVAGEELMYVGYNI